MTNTCVDNPHIDNTCDNTQVDNPRVNNSQVNNSCMAYGKFWKETLVGIVSLGILLAVLLTQIRFTINQTPSLSYRAFICIKGLAPERGDFVSISDHPTKYFEEIHYTKRLMGFPGDKIEIHGNQMYINHKCVDNTSVNKSCTHSPDPSLIGSLRKATQDGRALHPFKNTVIPEGYVFVSADHPRSFDSRYEEFGLVKQEHIAGKCFGLFKSNTHVQEIGR